MSIASASEYDFDGDEVADFSVSRPSNGTFYILNSSGDSGPDAVGGIQRLRFGQRLSDIPVTGDFDGDSIWDVAYRRPSTFEWFIRYSSTGEIVTRVFGRNALDIPVAADYDGDGITDIAVRRPSNKT